MAGETSEIVVYGLVGLVEGVVRGLVHGWECCFALVKSSCSGGVLYQGVIALPVVVGLLVEFQFDFDTFIDGLDHGCVLPG